MKRITVSIILFFAFENIVFCQIVSKDSLNLLFIKAPSFTIFQDNYFLTGISLNEKISNNSSDAKFQISFKQRLTNTNLPFNTYAFLTYTQKSFWDIYRNSSPFKENNYNPAIGIGKFFIRKNNSLNFTAITFEHESNGRDSIDSRSWNRICMNYKTLLSNRAYLFVKLWYPFDYKYDNPDLIYYVGYGEVSYNQKFINDKIIFDLTLRKGASWDNKGAFNSQIAFRLSKNANQYLSINYYYGYAENLINYKVKTQMIRFGIVIKPSKFNLY